MKKAWKNVALVGALLAVGVVSSATTVGMMRLNSNGGYSSDNYVAEGIAPTTSAQEYGFVNASLPASSRPVGSAPDLTPAAESSVKAVVHIKVKAEREQSNVGMDPFEFFFGGGSGQRRVEPVVGYGSGVIISSDGYIITNNHVIDGSQEISVTLNDNRTFSAKLIGTDAASDIALLKVEGKDLPTIPFGNSDNLRLGEWVLAVGNPFNLNSTVTAGIVSAKSRSTSRAVGSSGGLQIESFIQTDAAVNPGNSGGALVNASGELIGINTMIFSQTGNYAGYSFAVPINMAAKVVADIKKFGSVQRALLGIAGADVDADLAKKEGLRTNEGVYVAEFAEISAALAAGIEKGDVIVAIEGHQISTFAQLQEQIGRFRPGDTIAVKVNRKGAEKVFKVTLRNKEGGSGLIKENAQSSQTLGANLRALDANKLRAYGLSYGVEVASVGSGALKTAGVKPGFIILTAGGTPIKSVDSFGKAVSEAKRSQRKSLALRGFYPETGDVYSYVVEVGH